jgi:hypothetical protein
VIPVDGLIARGDYEHQFTLHQFTILPGGAAPKFKITQFDKIKIAASQKTWRKWACANLPVQPRESRERRGCNP